MKKFLIVCVLISLAISAISQENELPEGSPWQHNWQASITFSPDFFPFPFNNRKYFKTSWKFNFSPGALLLGRINHKWFLGAGIFYSKKDHEQSLSCQDCKITGTSEIKSISWVRYVELPVIGEYHLINNGITAVVLKTGVLPSFIDDAITRFTFQNGNERVDPANDDYFARYMMGIYLGTGITYGLSSKYSFSIQPHFKLYPTDIFRPKFTNLSSMGFLFKLNFHLD